jgi:hypothetical protein
VSRAARVSPTALPSRSARARRPAPAWHLRAWFEDELLYTGIAKVDPSTTNNPQSAGVAGRLSTYRNCRLTSDFAIAVAFRFIVANVSEEDRSRLASGELGVRAVQAMTKDWVATNVRFSVDAVTPAIAIAAESAVRRSGLAGSVERLRGGLLSV